MSLGAPDAAGQCQRAEFFPDAGSCKAYFGRSVAIDGDVAVVGANRDGDAEDCTGAAYVYRHLAGVWLPEAKLTAADAVPSQWFGYAVAIEGGSIFVGARYDDELAVHAGAVYEFQFSGVQWDEVAKLMAQDGSEYDIFGSALAVSRDRVIVGAPHDGWGSAYILERDGNGAWKQAAKLLPADSPSYEFASAVALDGDIAVVGSPNDDDLGNWSGSAYVFERDGQGTWKQTAKLLPSDGKGFWNFGTAVAVAGTTVLIGADNATGAVPYSGAAYLFERGNGRWAQVAKIYAADGINSGRFGCSAVLTADLALLGAEGTKEYGAASGAAYVFERQTSGAWHQLAKLKPTDGAAYDWFGHAVGLSESAAIIGAYEAGDSEDPGKAYVFGVGPDEDGDGVMDACEAPGDTNCDQVVNAFDIDPFVLALTDPAWYSAKFPQCTLVNADCNDDGKVDAFDIDPFVELLTGE